MMIARAAAFGFLLASAAQAAPVYTLSGTTPIGAPDKWDYTVFDAGSGRVYVAHGSSIAVLDGRTGKPIGTVTGIPGGTHGVAISAKNGIGITDDGEAGQAIAFDLKTRKIVARMPAADDADAVVADPRSGHIFVMNGDSGSITVVDPAAKAVVATIKVGEKLEYGAADGKGAFYVAGAGNRDLVRIDTTTNRVVAHWPAPTCESPHGLAIDVATKRLFMGCVNAKMMVIDGTDGHVVADLAIGRGSDAIAFDPVRKRVFSSNGTDGTISVWQQQDADHYRALDPVVTAVTGRTMTVDPQSGRLFVSAAEALPGTPPGARARPKPGSLRLLMFDPVAR